jgi:hypothetical protein
MLIFLSVVQMLLIVWLLLRTPSHNPLQNTFVEVFERLGRIEGKLSEILERLEPPEEGEAL